MNYAPPAQVKLCVCQKAGNPMGMMFCTFGHMTECHFPLQCHDAACGHLPSYDAYPPLELEALGDLAEKHLRDLATPDCEECQGAGRVETTFDIALIETAGQEPKPLKATAWYVCPCAALSLLKQE